MVGVPVLERAVDRGVMQLLRTILPLVTAAMVIVLLLVFGLRLDALAPLLLVGLSELVLFGAMGYAGARLHFVVAVVAPILLVVGLASAVHVLFTVRDRRKGGCDAVEAVVAAYRVKAWPVLWTGITTGVGFGSFASSPSLAIQSLGLWSAFGLTFLTFALLTFYPALLASLGGRRPAPPLGERVTNAARSIGARLFVRASSRPRACHLLFALTAAAAALGMPRLTLDTDLLHYVRPSSPARAEIERLEETGVGVLAADVVLTISGEGRAPGPLQGLDGLAELASLTDELRTLPAVLSGVSAADLVETVARHCLDANADTVAEGQGGSTEALARIAATPELDRTLRFLLTPSGRRARVSLLLHAGGIEELGPTLDDAAARARSRFPEAEVTVTGQYPLVLAAQGSILRSMALALGLTFLVVVVLFRIAVRTWNAAARALLANVWVVLVVLGVMGWTGTALDSVTIMVASAALGLVVDDTLHFIGFLRHELHPDSGGIEPASLRALRQAVPGHVLTSLVLTMGFAAVGLSPLVPVARFGTFLALAVVVALVADLVWVPTLLGSLRGRAAQRLRAP
jgi:hypothetical protein